MQPLTLRSASNFFYFNERRIDITNISQYNNKFQQHHKLQPHK